MKIMPKTPTTQELILKIEELESESERFDKIDAEYSAIFNNSTDLIFIINRDYRVTSVNPRASRFLNKKPGEIIGKSIRQLFPEEILKSFSNSLKKVFSTGESSAYDRSLTIGNRDYWIDTQLSPIKDQKGDVSAVIGVSRDISERKQAEEALKESEEKLRNFIELASLGIWCFQPVKPVNINLPEDQMIDEFFHSFCIECNDTYASMMGVAKEEILGLKLSDAMPDTNENRDYLRAFINNGFKLSGGISRELTEDGKEKYFSNSMVGVIKNGKLINAWGTQIDITERRQAEDALKKSEAQLRQIQKLEGIGQLAGGIAHDINNILTAMIGHTELALRGLKKNKNISNHLEQVMSSGKKAGDLVSKILAFGRRQIIYPEIINVNTTIFNLADTLHRVISEDIKLEMNLHDGISPVKADPTQIEQILINLVVNAQDAIKQRKERKAEKIITIETAEAFLDKKYVSGHAGSTLGQHILISVSDSGIGMDEKIISRVFEPFFTTKELCKGTGLGLSTVYGIVKQNQGSVYIYSEPGMGTTVKIYWPASIGKAPLEKPVEEEKIKGGSETIIFVEDDDDIRNASEQLLLLYGYKVFSTLNGRLALDLITNQNIEIDMLVTDVVMPELNGIELAKKLKQKFPGLKILYCSGYSNSNIISHNGIVDKDINFISKPYSSKELAKKIRKILDKK